MTDAQAYAQAISYGASNRCGIATAIDAALDSEAERAAAWREHHRQLAAEQRRPIVSSWDVVSLEEGW